MNGENTVVGGKYRLLRVIGRGGVSKVYLGEALADGKRYAVKEMDWVPDQAAGLGRGDKRAAGQDAGRGMWMEIRMQQKLHHPALPHIWDAWEERGKIYIVMDYVEGVPLDRLLREEGARPLDQALDWGLQLCRALLYLHSFQPPVIYRDMKPANVILREDGRLVLLDFGAARQYRARKRRDTVPLGTPGYAAPEQYRGRQSDVRTDIYCLGVTLYHMLTGHDPGEPPYRICGIREWNRGLPRRLERVVKKCTAQQRWRRYRSCEEVIRALERCQGRKR